MTELTSPKEPRGKPSPILLVFMIFPVLGILAAVALALSESQSANAPATPLAVTLADTSLIDQPAPNFQLASLDGSDVRLSSYRGRVVFLNFWATWCEPCQRELPAFQQFTEQHSADGKAVILAVNVNETPEQINTYFDERGVSGLNVLLDQTLDVYNAYAINVMPTTFILDAAGVVRYKHLGEMTLDDLQAYVDGLAVDDGI
ncbi:MAG: redoxin domain-containing protein [Anaerolineae bacterium]|nr:redoxin domain-containing protein [Anaerolineae bacterium]